MRDLMDRYKPETLTDVPAEILNIRQTNKDGQMILDNQLKEGMLDDFDEETSKRRRLMTDDERLAEAEADEVDNDKLWKTPQVIEQEKWLDKLSKHTVYCGKKKNDMIELARVALMHLPELDAGTQKTDLETDIKEHLKHVLLLANERNDTGDLAQYLHGGLVEWVDKTNYTVLEQFIDWNTARYLLDSDGVSKERKDATDKLIESTVKTTIACRYTEKMTECNVKKSFEALNRLPRKSNANDLIDNNNNH